MEYLVRRFEILPSGTAGRPGRCLGVASLALAALLATPALAQDNASGVEQIGTSAAQPVYNRQLAPGGPAIDLPPRGERESAPPPQLSASEESTPATRQLTREAESVRSAPQLYRGGRTAQPSTPLSSPDQGRTAAVARVQGEDRCDPRAPRSGESPACQRVIETRAAEFVRPAPTRLSPEQRLLGEQRMMPAASAQAAAQRLATNAANPNSIEDQSIASVVLGSTPTPTPGQTDEAEPAEDAATIEAIVNAVVNPTPQF